MSLEQVLTGAPENTQTEVEKPAEAVTTDTTVSAVQTPEAQTPEQGAKPAETPAAKPEKTVPLAALEDERRKRQEAEARLARQQQEQPKPGFWEQPEQHLAELKHYAATQALSMKLDVSENIARSRYEDFETQLSAFGELVRENPHLRVQMLQARDPAEFAYSTAKNHAALKAAGSIEGMRKTIETEVRAKIEAEMRAKAEADAKTAAALPTTLTTETGSAPRGAEYTGPTPLASILNEKR